MQLISYGGAESVTGSKHLLMTAGGEILLDCGMFQGRRAEAADRNRNFPKEVLIADAVILSHAHIDHSGALPSLVKAGYRGPIYATPATADLIEIMLRDSAHIAMSDAEHMSKKIWPPVKPIYTDGDVTDTLRLVRPVPYGQWFEPIPGTRARFHDAGHILGSAQVELEVEETGGRVRRIGFTGDLGRRNLPILRDPAQMTGLEALITESTYADREHEPIELAAESLRAVIERTMARGGRLLIPAFSVERTQEIIYVLHELYLSGQLRHTPSIFVDSPLATNATEVFKKHRDCYDAETYADFIEQGTGPFTFDSIEYVTDVQRSKDLARLDVPAIIISASGMCEAGRILHHLKAAISDPANTVLICGFQAVNTLGRKLVDQLPVVKIFGEDYRRRAEVAVLNSFSGHAGGGELFTNLQNCGAKKVYCVHGEAEAVQSLSTRVSTELGAEGIVPHEGELLTI